MRARLGRAVEAWGLNGLRALGGGNVALVCATQRSGRPVVLKVHPRGHGEEGQLAGEGAALLFWQRTGAVPRVFERGDEGLTLLMERLAPGQALDTTALPWDERLEVLGRLAARLHAAGTPPGGCVGMSDYTSAWRTALAGEPAQVAALDRLLVPIEPNVLIHADLHGGNALRHAGEWKAIDPHAVSADRHADAWALVDPLVPELPGDPVAGAAEARRRVALYATAAGMDAGRVAAWTRVRARAEALALDASEGLTSEDGAWARRLHRMADLL